MNDLSIAGREDFFVATRHWTDGHSAWSVMSLACPGARPRWTGDGKLDSPPRHGPVFGSPAAGPDAASETPGVPAAEQAAEDTDAGFDDDRLETDGDLAAVGWLAALLSAAGTIAMLTWLVIGLGLA